ncbi:MAG: chorismate synthase [Bacteroidales bacterium]|nr:chorismate synthase [Bacteroidales bacterium]
MSNTFGTLFRLTTFGESHGKAIGGIIDGCPSGLSFDVELLKNEMARRHDIVSGTPRQEPDEVEFISGLYEGKTLGTPLAFLIHNEDVRSDDYVNLAGVYRPGHADYTYDARYNIRDPRGGGRASARETAARVAGGAVAKMLLREWDIIITSHIVETGERIANDTCGGIIECCISNMPAGIGNPVFGKLNAMLAAAMMGIPSATGFEIGTGFESSKMSGSLWRDQWNSDFSTKTNHCGGIQGGISNGMPIVFRTAFHAASSVPQETHCIDNNGNIKTVMLGGRHDICHIPRTAVIVEAMAALTIADAMLLSGKTL